MKRVETIYEKKVGREGNGLKLFMKRRGGEGGSRKVLCTKTIKPAPKRGQQSHCCPSPSPASKKGTGEGGNQMQNKKEWIVLHFYHPQILRVL